MELVTVFIPPEKAPYTLFAEGAFVSIKGNKDEGYQVDFSEDYMLLLFYHFPFHRRLYVTVNHFHSLPKNSLMGVSQKRVILAELQGRAFDRMKRSLAYLKKLTGGNCFSFPKEFWLRFIALMRSGKNSQQNIDTLVKEFSQALCQTKL